MNDPTVSVVTSVYNGQAYLRESLQSVLLQADVDLEVVVVDDGSTDATPQILTELAAEDRRVRTIRQDNQGLTRALIRGCAEARGAFIARHDADDLSLPGRLAAELQLLQLNSQVAFVGCWSYWFGPEGELLFEVQRPADAGEATAGLLELGDGPPAHGSVMFSADAYRRAGGYRSPFRYAQDWDLWLRLAEIGLFGCVPQFGYAYRVSERSISALCRQEQIRLSDIARACHAARQRGEDEAPYLAEAAQGSGLALPATRSADSANSYFIGKCLLDRRDANARKYLWRYVRRRPWHLRGWAALGAAVALCRAAPPASRISRIGIRS